MTKAIHAARRLLEKHRKKQQMLHVAFLDLHREGLRPGPARADLARVPPVPGARESRYLGQAPLPRNEESSSKRCWSTEATAHLSSGSLLSVLVMYAITHDLQRPAPYTLF